MGSGRAGGLGDGMVRYVGLSCWMFVLQVVAFFVSTGRIDILRAWLFFSVTFAYYLLNGAVLYRFNPELLRYRVKLRRRGSKLWDEVLMRVINLVLLVVTPATAGLEVGRLRGSCIDGFYVVVGSALYVAGSSLVTWAMAVNPYFEPAVRIQRDRGHRVVTTGPYGFVRHPGYLGEILWALSVPLLLGSLLAFIPVVAAILLVVVRTFLEDRFSIRGLEGYAEYAERVRYRLFFGVW